MGAYISVKEFGIYKEIDQNDQSYIDNVDIKQ